MRRKIFLIPFILFLISPIILNAGTVVTIKTLDGYEMEAPYKGFFIDEMGNVSILLGINKNEGFLQHEPTINIENFQGCNGDNSTGIVNGTVGTELSFTVVASDSLGTPPNLSCLYPITSNYNKPSGVFTYTYNKRGTYLAIFSAVVQIGAEAYTTQRVIKINISDTQGDNVPPVVTITEPSPPSYSTTSQSITVKGTASDNVGVSRVEWLNSKGGGGVASGTTNWSFTVSLGTGENKITVKAYDSSGNMGYAEITITYSTSTGGYTDKVNRAIKVNGPFDNGYGYVFDVSISRGSTTYFLIDPKGFGVPYQTGKIDLSTISIKIEDLTWGERAVFQFNVIELDGNNDLVKTYQVSPGTGGMYSCYVKYFTLDKYNNGYKILIEAIEKNYGDTTMNIKYW